MPIVFARFFFRWAADMWIQMRICMCLYPVYSLFDCVIFSLVLFDTELHHRDSSDGNLFCEYSAWKKCILFHVIQTCNLKMCHSIHFKYCWNNRRFCSLEFCPRQISPRYMWQKQLLGKVHRTRFFSGTAYVPCVTRQLSYYSFLIIQVSLDFTFFNKTVWYLKLRLRALESSSVFFSVLKSSHESLCDLHITDFD